MAGREAFSLATFGRGGVQLENPVVVCCAPGVSFEKMYGVVCFTYAMKKTAQPRRARPSHVRRKSRLVLQIRPTISGDSLVSLPASRAVDRVHAACNDRLRSSRKVTWLGAVCAQASRLFIGASSSIPGQAPSQKKSANPVAGTPGIASACLSIISSTLLKDSCPSGAEAWYRAASPRVHVK